MSGFSDLMMDDGFSDPQDYMDYLEDKYLDSLNERDYDDDDYDEDNDEN